MFSSSAFLAHDFRLGEVNDWIALIRYVIGSGG